jgi:hypothetical protein
MNDSTRLVLSPLPKSWLLDLDGCIVRHNGHLEGNDELLIGVAEFWRSIPLADSIIVMSSRPETERQAIMAFFAARRLRVDHIILGLPHGERICVNDMKPSGLRTAVAINVPRDVGLSAVAYVVDESL